MKKITLLIVVLLLSIQSNAQIAPGSVAPNFTATDINGNVHTLSDYLAAGKTVIMDVSATWCGPCWNYHNTHALEDTYDAYGPETSNEVVVLFIEGDANTTLADLNGTGTNTQGNWVQNTPYPIIDGSNIGSLYQITYFPTVFRICPNGLVSEIGSSTASAIRASINSNCGIPPLVGVQNYAKAIESVNINNFCTSTGSPIAKVKNNGENVITTATLNLKENGNIVATKIYTGSIPRFVTRNITFDSMLLNTTSTYSVEVASVNSLPLYNPAFSNANMGISIADEVSDIIVKVYLDNYPSEASWKIKNSSGVVVASGGPYIGNANGGGADANTTKTLNVSLPAGSCYSVQLLDSFGDGWSGGQHGIEIFDTNNTSLYSITGNFSTSLNVPNVVTTAALANSNFEKSKTIVYPNPSKGIINVSTNEYVKISIIDVLGKTILQTETVSNDSNINLSTLQKGMYVIKIIGENTNYTEKLILN
jgi:Secretion system C-terminal sorting domain/AhpC/TSA family